MGKKTNPAQDVINQAKVAYQTNQSPTPLSSEYTPISQNFYNQYQSAVGRQTADYGNIMDQYNQFKQGLTPTQFSYQKVNSPRPAELGTAYSDIQGAMPGYQEFAATGGYSPTDIQELRARGMSPVRSSFANTMMELNRARALGGSAGAPNYIAALSRAQRELPQQLADAETGVNANLADAIRQGKLAGLAGETQVGQAMGGLASAEAGRQLQAQLANQEADLRAQGMSEQSIQATRQARLASISGQASLYGTTPAMASTFGNQALDAYQTRAALQAQQQNYGLGLLDAQLRAYGTDKQYNTPWWQTALGIAGTVAPFFA